MKFSVLSSLLFVSLTCAAPIRYDGNTWPEKLSNWKAWYEDGTLKGNGKTPREVYLANLRWAREKLNSQNNPNGYKAQIDSAYAQINDEDVKWDKKVANWDKWLKAGSIDRETYRKNMIWAKGKLASSNAAQVANLEATKARVNNALKQFDTAIVPAPPSRAEMTSPQTAPIVPAVSVPLQAAPIVPAVSVPPQTAPVTTVTKSPGTKIPWFGNSAPSSSPPVTNIPVIESSSEPSISDGSSLQVGPPPVDCSKWHGKMRPNFWPEAAKKACLPQ